MGVVLPLATCHHRLGAGFDWAMPPVENRGGLARKTEKNSFLETSVGFLDVILGQGVENLRGKVTSFIPIFHFLQFWNFICRAFDF